MNNNHKQPDRNDSHLFIGFAVAIVVILLCLWGITGGSGGGTWLNN